MINNILNKLGITELTPMQEEAGDAILRSSKDVVILSPTGSGKTLAYLLPLVQLMDGESNNVQAVVVTPGRELALQSSKVLREMGSGIRSSACYGGRMAMEEHRTLRQVEPQVVFGTPGRLNDHLQKGNILADDIKYLVIDEFDKCLEMGFMQEMQLLIKLLPNLKRRILLSATESEKIPSFVNMGRTERIDYRIDDEQVNERVKMWTVRSEQKDKLETLSKLLRHLGDEQSIVFLNHRSAVERTADYLKKEGFGISSFHGGMEQKQREDALFRFSNGSANIFVSTDLASRGLDIPDIANIIHYHLPESEDGYIHRVGRTARWDKEGRAFFILGPEEEMPEYVETDVFDYELPENLPQPARPKMTTIYIGKGKKDKISRGDILGFLCKKGGLSGNEIGKIDVRERYVYVAVDYKKVSQLLKKVSGEKIKGLKTLIEIVS